MKVKKMEKECSDCGKIHNYVIMESDEKPSSLEILSFAGKNGAVCHEDAGEEGGGDSGSIEFLDTLFSQVL